jgi:hypothetical protein
LSVGAKHLEDKLSVIAKNSSPNASPVQLLEDKLSVIVKNSSPNASPVQLLEDKLSVIAKNSSPNASPVQLSVVSYPLSVAKEYFSPVFPVPCSLFPLPLC